MYNLRPMNETDMDLVLEWRNRPEIRANMYTSHVISAEEHQRWFKTSLPDPAKRLLMCVDGDGAPVGVVIFSEINRQHGTATWAFYSGDTTRRGVGSEMEFLALDYAFGDLALEKLNCEVLSFNMPVVDFHRKHGFRLEGVFRAHFVRDGMRHDVYRLAHFRKSWLEHVRPAMVAARESKAPRPFKAGTTHRQKTNITRELVKHFAEVSGDTNSVHLDEAAARAAGFDGVIAHGMLVGAGLSKILGTDFPGRGTIYVSQSMQFVAPVYPDTELEYTLRIASIIGRRVIIETTVADLSGRTVLTGEAELLLPKEKVV
jgi:UDP-4-amino-4,6-dideoxy-N-acetyl-beta-L-altrosamine N-acetyltransferase